MRLILDTQIGLLVIEVIIILEIWKDVVGYEGLYQVSNLGRVRNIKRLNILKPHYDGQHRYLQVCLCKNGHPKNLLLHRVVAKTFIPSELDNLEVNHKDGNKTNNNVDNLEWCTRSENLEHAVNNGLVESQCKIRRSVQVWCDDEVLNFSDMKSCCEFFGFTKCWLGNYIRKHGNPCRYGKYTICVSERE